MHEVGHNVCNSRLASGTAHVTQCLSMLCGSGLRLAHFLVTRSRRCVHSFTYAVHTCVEAAHRSSCTTTMWYGQ